jgi:hypothetical protein
MSKSRMKIRKRIRITSTSKRRIVFPRGEDPRVEPQE